jgi:ADP-ribosylglycohydrolase/fructose-1,6-bisphosphatase/inositol monophosphatase family enzyme
VAGTYIRELETATQAALAAGAMLRDEFHRPEGPRGADGHADVDDRAEAAIYGTLTNAFPEYGYRGEELGFKVPARDAGRHMWIVDPNDGTSDFLRGYRGASASIALIRGGVPVLGVVYAYAAPDDGGDLIVWAEGCGPVRRNGVTVVRDWPSQSSELCTVLVSVYADERTEANVRALAPMRFRGMPSIAYRLALIAIGDADAMAALNSPSSWDFAAGHALLIGCGGLLIDARGRGILYGEDGIARSGGAIFGGADSLVTELTERDWRQVVTADRERKFSFCRPSKIQPARDPELVSRAQGAMIGQLAGDSLGSLVEFLTPEKIRARYPAGLSQLETGGVWGTLAGQPTDDSEMALALARTIVRTGLYDPESVRQAYREWLRSDPFDIGSTTRQSLSTGVPNTTSQANGSLMRVSPIGIAFEPDTAVVVADGDAGLTHANVVCRQATAIFARSSSYAIRSGAPPEEVYKCAVHAAVHPAIKDALEAAQHGPPRDYLTHQGWVLIAFQNAFYQLLHASSVEAGLTDTVMRGGDTDTNAAVAGALLGAVHGLRSMPHQWVDRILTCRPLEGMPGVNRPRPMQYWPVDALYLAERLLGVG